MKFEVLADFILFFLVFVAEESLRKLHSLGQPLSWLLGEAIVMAAGFSLLKWSRNWFRKHGDG